MVQPGNNGIPADPNMSPSQVYTLMLLYSHTNCKQLGLLWQLARSTGGMELGGQPTAALLLCPPQIALSWK
jgi:hypothetical protein